jgi:hypothetical protein
MYEELLGELERVGPVVMMNSNDEARTRSIFEETFGTMFDPATSPASGKRAEVLCARERPDAVLVLSQPRQRFTPHMSASPLRFAIRCELANEAAPPLLGRFADLEPCVLGDDFAWVMVHTHEDHAVGGPYFVRAESVYSGQSHPPR